MTQPSTDRTRVLSALDLEKQDTDTTDIDWNDFWTEISESGVLVAVMNYAPQELLMKWLRNEWKNVTQEKDAEVFMNEFIRADRVDAYEEFLGLLGSDAQLFENFSDKIAASNFGWKLLVRSVKPRLDQIAAFETGLAEHPDVPESPAIINYFGAAAKSSDVSHFILLHRLADSKLDSRKRKLVVYQILRTNNLPVLYWYYTNHPEEVREVLFETSAFWDLVEFYEMAEFLVHNMSDSNFKDLIYENKGTPNSLMLKAMLTDSRMKQSYIDAILVPRFYTGIKNLCPKEFQSYVNLLKVSVSDYIRKGNLKHLTDSAFDSVLLSKKLPLRIQELFGKKMPHLLESLKNSRNTEIEFDTQEIQLLSVAISDRIHQNREERNTFLESITAVLSVK